MPARFSLWKLVAGSATALTLAMGSASAQTPAPPPRTISDLTAILEQEKPDTAALARRQQEADAVAPSQATDGALAEFYGRRAQMRSALGRARDAVADVDLAIEFLDKHAASVVNPSKEAEFQLFVRSFRLEQFRVAQLANTGLRQPKKALALSMEMARKFDRPSTPNFVLFSVRHAIQNNLVLGHLETAVALLETLTPLMERARTLPGYATHGAAWEAEYHNAKALIAEAHGDDKVAEIEFLRASELWFRYRDAQGATRTSLQPLQISADATLASAGMRKVAGGRFAEGEADVRRALLGHLRLVGRHHTATAYLTRMLALALMEQGRAADAEVLLRSVLETYDFLSIPADSNVRILALANLARILESQGRWAEATAAYTQLKTMTADWEPSQREGYLLSPPYINALYRTGRFAEGVEIARSLVARSRLRVGERHFFHGLARGYLATGLSRLGRDSEALQEFAAAMPILSSQQRQAGDGAGAQANRDRQTQEVVEAFIDLLTRVWTPVQKASFTGEAFRLADMVRGSAVQGAIAQSSARMAIDDPVLAALARNEQDLGKRVGAQYQLLNNVLALPSSDRDDKVEAGLRTAIVGLEVELDQVRERIARDFPGYAALVNPQPATIEQVQAALKPDEAFLSIYSGHDRTYVWAVPREGPAAFAVVPLSAAALEQKVARLRSALEPAVETIGDIPPFDTALSAELHDALLKPVEAGWKSARNLVVSTNGALAKLPFGVLVTGPLSAPAAAAALPFADYRQVPWLSRSHAVTSVPSAATFTILRRLPAGKASREKLIAFGDPLFNREQAAEAARPAPPVTMASATTMRGLPLLRRAAPQIADKNSVTLADLPRLADTADELKSIASTMGADPAQALHLGVEANEPKVAALPLANYRVVAFATHGLVPGELDGLTQPALALSASDVAGVGGDGLLTMEEILALKLDADWVVLSACNTGSGANAGAEAASGLGRAFFYAGTRAVLVTNWSVHSASARDLVSDVFRRQSTDPAVGRAEALRRAMLGLMDGPGYVDGSGKSLFSYGHPLFWAPYTVIGDGG